MTDFPDGGGAAPYRWLYNDTDGGGNPVNREVHDPSWVGANLSIALRDGIVRIHPDDVGAQERRDEVYAQMSEDYRNLEPITEDEITAAMESDEA
jgi:hypothetical protein